MFGPTVKEFYQIFGELNMNLQERLAQCRKDKAAIEKEEQELLKQIKEEKEVPIISFVDFDGSKNRVVINLTKAMFYSIRRYPDCKQIVIDRNGSVGDHRFDHKLTQTYSNQQPVFGTMKLNQ